MRIAIVGGIGSGKSEVLNVAKTMGFATASADEINSELLENPEYIATLAEEFPFAVKDGRVDRMLLANVVFSDKKALEILNALAHPRILAYIRRLEADPLVVELPLMLESGAQGLFDKKIYIKTPTHLRLKFLKEQRGMSYADARSRMRNQASPSLLESCCDIVIENNSDLNALRQKAEKLFEKIREECYAHKQ